MKTGETSQVKLNVYNRVIPVIYGYSTPDVPKHNGYIKVGETKRDANTRIKEQVRTADIDYKLEFVKNAVFENSLETFRDKSFHKYLRQMGVENKPLGSEWFKNETNGKFVKDFLNDFRENHGFPDDGKTLIRYMLRKEQENAVRMTYDYFLSHEKGEFLWNAKPRFGKTLASLELVKQLTNQNKERITRVLVVTNRPAISNSWYDDYVSFIGRENGCWFISNTDSLKNKPLVVSREKYLKEANLDNTTSYIEFVSLQDLKGSIYFGGYYDKLRHILDTDWDLLIVDECHEGVDTYKTDKAFDRLKRRNTLHLSGTPFKALANNKFNSDAIFNWTYADEQAARNNWEGFEYDNPYVDFPKLTLYCYKISDMLKKKIKKGLYSEEEVEGSSIAFDLNEFFKTDNSGKFVYEEEVDMFLNSLTTNSKYPFSTEEFREMFSHTLWYMYRVDSAKAMAKKLKKHPVFKDYHVILAAGDGKITDFDENELAYNRVIDGIKNHPKTITITVGQLTTGVTVPEWSAILMLNSLQSASLYMQAAFRVQNPCLYSKGNNEYYKKVNAYIFDFDPIRPFVVYEQFAKNQIDANPLITSDIERQKDSIRRLSNFFPVIGEDEDGQMIELSVDRIILTPNEIKRDEVIKSGFRSNFLFKNITNVFKNSEKFIEILEKIPEVKDFKKGTLEISTKFEDIDENGDVLVHNAEIIDKQKELFGDKVYERIELLDTSKKLSESVNTQLSDTLNRSVNKSDFSKIDTVVNGIKTKVFEEIKNTTVEQAKKAGKVSKSTEKKIEKEIQEIVEKSVETAYTDYKVKLVEVKNEYESVSKDCKSDEEFETLQNMYSEDVQSLTSCFNNTIAEDLAKVNELSMQKVAEELKREEKERKKKHDEGEVKGYLHNFTRCIPLFLMAYGDEDTTLSNFHTKIPASIFEEVLAITLEEFMFLRDGDEDYPGGIFDEGVFNSSCKGFYDLREKLSNWWDETIDDDIFNYIPHQKTNQIFTPPAVVKEMFDLLECVDPACYDSYKESLYNPYCKSGQYAVEYARRLFRSPKMVECFPNAEDRLRHIIKYQMFVTAPTEITLQIGLQYILGANKDLNIAWEDHNIRKCDILSYSEGEREKAILSVMNFDNFKYNKFVNKDM